MIVSHKLKANEVCNGMSHLRVGRDSHWGFRIAGTKDSAEYIVEADCNMPVSQDWVVPLINGLMRDPNEGRRVRNLETQSGGFTVIRCLLEP